MSVTNYGLTTGDWEARPDFVARREKSGAWSGSNSFSMLGATWEQNARTVFLKGTPITSLFTQLDAYWSFLELEEVDVAQQPGGWVQVFCEYTGWTEAEYDEDEDVTYVLSGTRAERSILLHPLYVKEMAGVAGANQANMAAAYNGIWAVDEGETIDETEITFYNAVDRGRSAWILTEEDAVKWARVIFVQGHRTYMAPTLQWTCETSSELGWRDGDTQKLALVEYSKDNRPPGNPPMPVHGNFEWMKISMNQTLQSGRARQSQTWELSPPGGFHRFPGEGFDGEGIYKYELSRLDR